VTTHDLSQADTRRTFQAQGDGPWTVVHDEICSGGISIGAYCALADPAQREKALGMDGWILTKSSGSPGFMQSWDGGKEVVTYLPTGSSDDGIEPLVLVREFYGAAESTLELDQQFRLFHNLRYDPASNTYMKMNEDGTQTLAVKFTGERMEVRTSLLKHYVAARQVDLLLFIEATVYSSEPAEMPTTDRFTAANFSGRLDYFRARFSSSGDHASRYTATKVIPPGPVETCGIWPYEEDDDHFPEFVVGEDDHGRPVRFTCNPDLLANYFGKNPDAPHYLTPVHFRREVLAKYYDNPELYTVEDGYLRCASLWGVQIDNDHADRVVVFLGDIGRDLPASERDHWRGYMVAPDAPISETNLRRSFLAQATDPTAVDLVFRRLYVDATNAWNTRYGWPLFRQPRESDVYLLQQLRLPLNDSQNEFEDAIKVLAKLVSDALNEGAIQKALGTRIENEKGISKFERFLTQEGYLHVARDISYLRKVQELRSKVSAHLKGSDYQKMLTKNLGADRGAKAIRVLLVEGKAFLQDLVEWVGPTDDDIVAEPGVGPDPVSADGGEPTATEGTTEGTSTEDTPAADTREAIPGSAS